MTVTEAPRWQHNIVFEAVGSPFTRTSHITFSADAHVARHRSRNLSATLGECVGRNAQRTRTWKTTVRGPKRRVAIETSCTHLTVNALRVVSAVLYNKCQGHITCSQRRCNCFCMTAARSHTGMLNHPRSGCSK